MTQNIYEPMPSKMALSRPESLAHPLQVTAATLLLIAATAMIFAGIWELFLIIEYFADGSSLLSSHLGHRSSFVDTDGIAASTVRLLGFFFFAIVMLTLLGALTFGGKKKRGHNTLSSIERDNISHSIPFQQQHTALLSTLDEPRYSM